MIKIVFLIIYESNLKMICLQKIQNYQNKFWNIQTTKCSTTTTKKKTPYTLMNQNMGIFPYRILWKDKETESKFIM